MRVSVGVWLAVLVAGLLLASFSQARAAAWCNRLIKRPGDELMEYRTALRLHVKNQLFSAETLYDRALRLEPGHVPSLNNLAVIYAASNREPQALTLLRRAQAKAPDAAEVTLNLVDLLLKQDDWAGAEKALGKYLEGREPAAEPVTTVAPERAMPVPRAAPIAEPLPGFAAAGDLLAVTPEAWLARLAEENPEIAEASLQNDGTVLLVGSPRCPVACLLRFTHYAADTFAMRFNRPVEVQARRFGRVVTAVRAVAYAPRRP